jgi:hypothetical protein
LEVLLLALSQMGSMRASGETDQGGAVEVVVTPVALRVGRGEVRIGCGLGEACGAVSLAGAHARPLILTDNGTMSSTHQYRRPGQLRDPGLRGMPCADFDAADD